jgi:hypothetical protein
MSVCLRLFSFTPRQPDQRLTPAAASLAQSEEIIEMNLRLFLSIVSLAALVLGGCASAPGGGSSSLGQYRGVLSQPQRLEAVPGQAGAYRWIASDADLGKYRKVELDRIRVRLDDNVEYKSIDPGSLSALVDYFGQAIQKALGPQYPLVNQPGPDVLRVRITLVDIVPNDVDVTGAMTVLGGPIATAMVSRVSGEPPGAAPYMGRTGVAVEFVDSQTGRLIGEYADTQFGQQYVLDPNKGLQGLVDANAKGTMDSLSKWAYVHQAFDKWAMLFRTRLDQAHGL